MELGGCLGYSRRRKLKMSADYYEIQDQLGVEKRTVRALAFFWSLLLAPLTGAIGRNASPRRPTTAVIQRVLLGVNTLARVVGHIA